MIPINFLNLFKSPRAVQYSNREYNNADAEPGYFTDELALPHSGKVPISRDSETNRSRGKLEIISQAAGQLGVNTMRTFFGRLTSKG